MNNSECRNSFDDVEDNRLEFGKLTYEEAHALVAAIDASTTIKACMMSVWHRAREEYEKNNVRND